MYAFIVRSIRKQIVLALTLSAAAVAPSFGQLGAPTGGGSSGSRATALPQSGRNANAGNAQAAQSSNSGSGIATVNSSVQVSGDVSGSIAINDLPPGPVNLTLGNAVERALRANLGTATAGNSVRAARAQRLQTLSALLPSISANLSETVAQTNLAAYGFQFSAPAGSNITIPTVVGPYSYSQAQAQLSQSVFDLVQRRNWQASKQSERASVLNAKDTRELIVLAVGGTYLQAVAAAAKVDSQRAQVDNAKAVYNQAVVRKQAGTNAKIDVMRSLVEFQTQQQRLSSYQSDLSKQKITLARIIGIPLDRELNLAETLGAGSYPVPLVEEEIQRALAGRADLRSAEVQVKAAELALSAAHAERYPSASVNGNYGVIGPNPASTHGVFTATGSVNIPIWQGGRVKGDILEAEATLSQRQAEVADQRGKIEAEVRTAHVDLTTALGQLQVAGSNRDYARETLTEARDRFTAGVSTTVEVVQAQEQLASAENDYVSSLFSFNLAKLSLARSTGSAESILPKLLSSSRTADSPDVLTKGNLQ